MSKASKSLDSYHGGTTQSAFTVLQDLQKIRVVCGNENANEESDRKFTEECKALAEAYSLLIASVSREALSQILLNNSQRRLIAGVMDNSAVAKKNGIWVINGLTILAIATYIESFYHPQSAPPTKSVPPTTISTEIQKKVDETLG